MHSSSPLDKPASTKAGNGREAPASHPLTSQALGGRETDVILAISGFAASLALFLPQIYPPIRAHLTLLETILAPILGALVLALSVLVLLNPKKVAHLQGIILFAAGGLFVFLGFCAKLSAGGDHVQLAATYLMWVPFLMVFGALVVPFATVVRLTWGLLLALALATGVWLGFTPDPGSATLVVQQFLILGFLSLIAMTVAIRELGVRFSNVIEDLAAARAAADHANRAKTELLARMSHDLRTPLNAVIGFADVIRSEVLGGYESWPRYRDYAGDIVQSGEFLLAMVNDLLDIARIEAGGLTLEPEPVAIDSLVGQVVARLRQQAARDGVTLLDESTEGAGTLVVDPRALEQIVQNLLSNAVKFTPTGKRAGVRLSRGEQTSRGEETLTITIWDNGIGIAAEELPHLGEPFRRIGRTDFAKRPGTGLGIAIVKNLVALHGGTLTFESVLGEGTTAIVTLPLSQPVPAATLPPGGGPS